MSRCIRRLAKLVTAGLLPAMPLTRQRRGDLVRRFRRDARCSTSIMPRIRRPMTDANFVLTGSGGIVEIQATAEGAPFDEAQFAEMLRAGARRHRRPDRVGSGGARPGSWAERWRGGSPASGWSSPATIPARSSRSTALLTPFGVETVGAAALGLPEPEETGDDIRGQRRAEGARPPPRRAGLPALADDSGLVVPALGGAPGIYSARWAGPGQGFRARDGAGAARARRQGPQRPFRGGAGAGVARRRDRDVPRRGSRPAGLAAARRPRLRLRPDVRARRRTT